MVSQPHRRCARERALTADEALAVAALFGIELEGARAVALSGGYSNETFRIDSRGGRFVVRRYGRLHVSLGAIAFEHAVMTHAAQRMAEVVAPLRAGTETIAVAPDGGLCAVLPYVDGTAGYRDPATGSAVARVLGRFHRAMRDVHVAGGMRSSRFLGALPWLRERFTRFAADPLVARALDWSGLVAAVTAATARVAPLASELAHVVVHGDPNPGNAIAAGSGDVRALIDFDFAHESERVYDVGTLLDEFARPGDDAALDLELIGPLVAAYAEEAPMTHAERDVVPEAMLRRAATLVWYVATRHGERVPGDVGGAPRYAARVAEIVARRDEIRSAVG